MNPYQRIIRNGQVIQPGSIDTRAKYEQLINCWHATGTVAFTATVPRLAGMTVLDVGCNLGEMCRMAKDDGAAIVRGIDKEPEFVAQARQLHPDIPFDCWDAERANGHGYDIVFASAMLHYCGDLKRTLQQLARVGKSLVCDVWLNHDAGLRMNYDRPRRLFHPTRDLWERLCSELWESRRTAGEALSPDGSYRLLYCLTGPKAPPAKAVLLYGTSGSGKTTRARELQQGLGYDHFQLDSIFLEWRINIEPGKGLSVSDLAEEVWRQGGLRLDSFLAFHRLHLFKWLGARMNRDVVIEGYDMIWPRYMDMVRSVVRELHWTAIEEHKL